VVLLFLLLVCAAIRVASDDQMPDPSLKQLGSSIFNKYFYKIWLRVRLNMTERPQPLPYTCMTNQLSLCLLIKPCRQLVLVVVCGSPATNTLQELTCRIQFVDKILVNLKQIKLSTNHLSYKMLHNAFWSFY